jgi:hypothetical protein
LIATKLEDFLAGKRDFDLLFEPGPRVSLDSYAPRGTRSCQHARQRAQPKVYALRYENGRVGARAAPGHARTRHRRSLGGRQS